MVESVTAAPRRPRRGQVVLAWLFSISGAIVVDLAAVWGALQIVEFRSIHTEQAMEVGSTSRPLPRPTPTLTGPPEPPRDDRVPTECGGLYSADMVGTLAASGLRLQVGAKPAETVESGSADEALRALLVERPLVECVWLDSSGGERSGVLTVVAEATPQIAAAVDDRAENLGMTRLAENGGHRWVTEDRDGDGRRIGESHFLRDGVWFATRWYGQGPFGYTADMVKQVFA